MARYGFEGSFFGQDGSNYTSTGAPGSPVAAPESTQGPVVGSPAVLGPYQSAQLPVTRVDVTAGDTSAMSSDGPVPSTGDPLTGLGLDFIASTGAGQGSTTARHPNSTARPA